MFQYIPAWQRRPNRWSVRAMSKFGGGREMETRWEGNTTVAKLGRCDLCNLPGSPGSPNWQSGNKKISTLPLKIVASHRPKWNEKKSCPQQLKAWECHIRASVEVTNIKNCSLKTKPGLGLCGPFPLLHRALSFLAYTTETEYTYRFVQYVILYLWSTSNHRLYSRQAVSHTKPSPYCLCTYLSTRLFMCVNIYCCKLELQTVPKLYGPLNALRIANARNFQEVCLIWSVSGKMAVILINFQEVCLIWSVSGKLAVILICHLLFPLLLIPPPPPLNYAFMPNASGYNCTDIVCEISFFAGYWYVLELSEVLLSS